MSDHSFQPHQGNGDDTTSSTWQQAKAALVLHPHILDASLHRGEAALRGQNLSQRTPEAQLAEIVGLAEALDVSVQHQTILNVRKRRPSTLFGSGQTDEIGALLRAAKDQQEPLDVVVVDCALTPIQQRNLERAWNIKVIDRTGLILAIFAARAATREGRLQVELAQLTYQRTRLVRSWTHLERQRGGLGTVGGPGERQLEIDRRLIDERITKLRRELTKVQQTRALQQRKRQRVPYPLAVLVGYTNAGKSTLFNRLTDADVKAEDMLFATLDTTVRGIDLQGNQTLLLADTVGFISALPTQLIAAFRATLEHVREADIILHVRDASHPDTGAQSADVLQVLAELGVDEQNGPVMFDVYNKIDLLEADRRQHLQARLAKSNQPAAAVSAVTGAGIDDLKAKLTDYYRRFKIEETITVSAGEGALIAWLYRHADILTREDEDGLTHLKFLIDPINLGRLQKQMRKHAPSTAPDGEPANPAGM